MDDRRPPEVGPLDRQDPSESGVVPRAVLDSVREVPAEQAPHRLCALCARLLSIDGAALSLMAGTERRTLAVTDEVVSRLVEAQYVLGIGPCPSALAFGAPMLAADLSRGDDARRWPVFAQRALELGVKAVFSFPLAIGAVAAGTLDMYRRAAGALSPSEVGAALLIADTATLAVLRVYAGDGERVFTRGEGDLSRLGGAEDHDEVHQATGMVMIQCAVGADEALLRLRARAFASGMTLAALAHEVVERRARFD